MNSRIATARTRSRLFEREIDEPRESLLAPYCSTVFCSTSAFDDHLLCPA